ncbi:MAG: hypothetical protein WCQ47_07420 [bacterium]
MKKVFLFSLVCFMCMSSVFAASKMNCKMSNNGKYLLADDISSTSASETANCPDRLIINFHDDDIKEAKIISNLATSIRNGSLCVYSFPRIVENDPFTTISCEKVK